MPRIVTFNCRADLRSLGLFRILFAAVLIGDWCARWRDLTAFYTSEGVLPNSLRLLTGATTAQFSLLDWLDSPGAVRCFFLATLAVYALMLVGWQSRWAAIASLVAFVSIAKRNLFVLIGADQVVVTMLFWSALLPLGRRFSLDARRNRKLGLQSGQGDLAGNCHESLAVLGVTLQIALIYLCTAIAKNGQTWIDGDAMYYAAHFAAPGTALAQWMSAAPPGMIRAMTWGVLTLEYAVAPLMLAPWWQPYLRRAAIVALAAMHVGITLWMDVGSFSYVMIASYALLLGADDWALARRCAGRCAPRRAGSRAAGAFSEMGVARASRIENGLAIVLLAYCVPLAFARNVPPSWFGTVTLPRAYTWLAEATLVSQTWNMFAPNPPRYSRWWVCDGTLNDGTHWDPLVGGSPSLARPAEPSGGIRVAWREYMKRAWVDEGAPSEGLNALRGRFCRYLADHGPAPPPTGKSVESLRIDFMRDRTQPQGTNEPFPTQVFDLGTYERKEDRYEPSGRPDEWIEWHSPRQPKSRGALRNKKRDGTWTFWHVNGQMKESKTFEHGQQTGSWREWDEHGKLVRAVHISNGQLNGPAEIRLPDGRMERGNFVADRKEGTWITTYPSGVKAEEGTFVGGRRQGRWMAWRDDGQVLRSAELTDDVPNGEYAEWHENGQLMKQGRYAKEKADGQWTYWHPNGQKQMEGTYRAGMRHGLWRTWNAAGRLEAEQEYRDGLPIQAVPPVQ